VFVGTVIIQFTGFIDFYLFFVPVLTDSMFQSNSKEKADGN